jgi:UDP-N-acetylglucosamine 2-epimerase (non-hydrolysing)
MIMQGLIALDPVIEKQVEMCRKDGRKIVVLTAHRRESFGKGLEHIFNGIKRFAQKHQDVAIFYPVHPNPHVLSAVKASGLNSFPNIYLSNPLSYANLIFLLISAHLVVTDSGGIQEEAVSLGKYVLVLRDKSERVECFWEGCGKLVGTNEHILFENMCDFFSHNNYEERKKLVFGDGTAVERIVTILKTIFEVQQHCLPADDKRQSATI